MGRPKFTYAYVRDYLASFGYVLLSEEYINSSTPIKYGCPKGHVDYMRFGNFKNLGRRCPVCADNKRRTIESIREEFEDRGFILLSGTYKNKDTHLEYICPKGHKGNTLTYRNFRAGRGCQECGGTRKKSFDEVYKEFAKQGYEILDTPYINNRSKLECRCNRGHIVYASLVSVAGGHGCHKCFLEDAKPAIGDVVAAFEGAGLILLSREYINNVTGLRYGCMACGHVGSKSYAAASMGSGCPMCAKKGAISAVSQEWLGILGSKNIRREYSITELGIKVDGYDPETNTVYEFLGDFWHGNPEIYDPEDINRVNKKSYGQLYKETLRRFRLLEEVGYKVIYIWEKDFRTDPYCEPVKFDSGGIL